MPARIVIAMSLDGFIDRPDGEIDGLTPSPETIEIAPGEDYGYDAFMASVDAIVVGRHSVEQVLTFGAAATSGTWMAVSPRGANGAERLAVVRSAARSKRPSALRHPLGSPARWCD